MDNHYQHHQQQRGPMYFGFRNGMRQFSPPVSQVSFMPTNAHEHSHHHSYAQTQPYTYIYPHQGPLMPAVEYHQQPRDPATSINSGMVNAIVGTSADATTPSQSPFSSMASALSRHDSQHQQPVRSLLLKPISHPSAVLNILIPSSTSNYSFTVHQELLAHHSPYFRSILRSLGLDNPSLKVKSMKVKVGDYKNELDFNPRVTAGPMDLENSDLRVGPKGDEKKERAENKECEEVELNVAIQLPPNLAPPREIHLPKELGFISQGAFLALLNWLYLNDPSAPSETHKIDACTLIELWVLAGRLQIPACQNDCIIAIERFRCVTNTIETGMLKWAYTNTEDYKLRGEKCGLRNLLIDQCAWLLDEAWLYSKGDSDMDNEQVFPREALIDLFARMRILLRVGKGIDVSIGEELGNIELRKGDRYWVSEGEVEHKDIQG